MPTATTKEISRMLAQALDTGSTQRALINALEMELDHVRRELIEERKENAALKRAAPTTRPTAEQLSRVFTEAYQKAIEGK